MATFSIRYRVQEWLADHFRRIQYPRQPRQEYIPAGRPIFTSRAQQPKRLGFLQSLAVFQLGLLGILVGALALAFGIAFLWMLVRAILTT